MLNINVTGIPTPQGSKKGFVINGRAVIVDDNKRPLKNWRQDVRIAALAAISDHANWTPLDGPVFLEATFYMPRPAGHYGSGRNAHVLKPSAPTHPDRKPDLDKLLRSTLDALGEAGCWRDDARVTHITATKEYADDVPVGASLVIAPHVETITTAGQAVLL